MSTVLEVDMFSVSGTCVEVNMLSMSGTCVELDMFNVGGMLIVCGIFAEVDAYSACYMYCGGRVQCMIRMLR